MSSPAKAAIQEIPTDSAHARKFGTFTGVFRPTILTILGVMMYLREGWLVGHGGILGAIAVIAACYLITGTTALSLSSITTNIRVGSGGAFSIISQSLGLEVGGAIGIPFYLAQGVSAAMYLYGFWEGWHYLFPGHPQTVVLGVSFGFVVALSYFSASLAFRVQIVILFSVVLALISMAAGTPQAAHGSPHLMPATGGESFRSLFAVFFPASTGIMVGASMSGNLLNPRRSIPAGTMAAWGVSLAVYIALAVWYGSVAAPEELRTAMTIGIDRARWPQLVLVGVILSCFCAALSSLVAAPRVLQALAANQLIPLNSWFAREPRGEPRNAVLFTASLVAFALLAGDLNTIATILTMFFLMAYFAINGVVALEQGLDLLSFRPEFQIPRAVPIAGAVASLLGMIAINPLVGLLAIAITIGVYIYLDRLRLETPWETVHSSLFFSIANWAARRANARVQTGVQRSWRPNFLIPIEREIQFEGNYRFVRNLVYSQGSVHVVALRRPDQPVEFDGLPHLVQALQQEDGLFANHAVLDVQSFCRGLRDCVAVMAGVFFRPNIIFTSTEGRTDEDIRVILHTARQHGMGVLLLALHPIAGLGRERNVTLWVRDQSPDWQLGLKLANLDLAVLMSHQLCKNWGAAIQLRTVVRNGTDVATANRFLTDLLHQARMSKGVQVDVRAGSFRVALQECPRADIHVLGLAETTTVANMHEIVSAVDGSCLFVMDSGSESALA